MSYTLIRLQFKESGVMGVHDLGTKAHLQALHDLNGMLYAAGEAQLDRLEFKKITPTIWHYSTGEDDGLVYVIVEEPEYVYTVTEDWLDEESKPWPTCYESEERAKENVQMDWSSGFGPLSTVNWRQYTDTQQISQALVPSDTGHQLVYTITKTKITK